ncbi:hypothetical protein ABIB81_007765 [Bradyrhizobium sp. I1.7.5]
MSQVRSEGCRCEVSAALRQVREDHPRNLGLYLRSSGRVRCALGLAGASFLFRERNNSAVLRGERELGVCETTTSSGSRARYRRRQTDQRGLRLRSQPSLEGISPPSNAWPGHGPLAAKREGRCTGTTLARSVRRRCFFSYWHSPDRGRLRTQELARSGAVKVRDPLWDKKQFEEVYAKLQSTRESVKKV